MITYILNFVLCSGVMWLAYRLFLAGENMYVFNRFYLLFSIIFSLAVPLTTIHLSQPEATVAEQHLNLQNAPDAQTPLAPAIIVPAETKTIVATQQPAAISHTATISNKIISNWQQILITIYFAVCFLLLLRFIRNLYLFRKIITSNASIDLDDNKLVLLNTEVAPHSFLKYIFVSRSEYMAGEIQPEIICHEQTHARQLHSLDIIFLELLQIICWFNPVLPLYRRSVQLNHEFLADEAVINNYDDTPAYQHLLLNKIIRENGWALSSEFVNYLTIRRRLLMMKKSTTRAEAWVTWLAVIPVTVIAFVLFSNKVRATTISADHIANEAAVHFPKITYTDKQLATMDDLHKAQVIYQDSYDALLKRNLAEEVWNKTISVKITGKCENDNGSVVGVIASYNERQLLIETSNGNDDLLIDILKPKDEVKIKVFGASYFYRKDRPLEITPDYIEKEGVKIFDRQENQQKPVVKQNHDVVKFPPPVVFADPMKFEDVPPASVDAPQSVLDEYTSIIKRYHLDKGKQNRRVYAKLDQATRLKMESLFDSMSKGQQDKQAIKFGKLMVVADKLTPTDEQFQQWNSKRYQIWIDGRKQSLGVLTKFKPIDFAFYDVNDISNTSNPQKYRVSLLTLTSYDRTAEQIKSRHFRPVIYANQR